MTDTTDDESKLITFPGRGAATPRRNHADHAARRSQKLQANRYRKLSGLYDEVARLLDEDADS